MMQLTRNRVAEKILMVGVLAAALIAAYLLAAKPAHASTTFTVTNTNDGGPGSLRQAMLDANSTAGADTISFSIPGGGVKTIAPDSELPNIDLGFDGPTANDPGDTDTGPNKRQNKPVLSSASKGGTDTTTVRGTLKSVPNETFRVQFFSNPGGGDEGKTLLGSVTVSTDGSGYASFNLSTKKAIRLGQNITATATGVDGTSEFSAPRRVVARLECTTGRPGAGHPFRPGPDER